MEISRGEDGKLYRNRFDHLYRDEDRHLRERHIGASGRPDATKLILPAIALSFQQASTTFMRRGNGTIGLTHCHGPTHASW